MSLSVPIGVFVVVVETMMVLVYYHGSISPPEVHNIHHISLVPHYIDNNNRNAFLGNYNAKTEANPFSSKQCEE